MTRCARIENLLREDLSLFEFSLIDESSKHRLGPESHFKLILVTKAFDGLTKIQRHRLIYRLLAEEFKQGLHALSLHLYTLAEWENAVVLASPACHGSKKRRVPPEE